MLPVEDQLSLLVRLSKADKFVAAEEIELIHSMAKKHGLNEEQVENIINDPKPILNLKDLPSHEKFNYLFNIIQLMKVDRKIHPNEIDFCERIALKLGYKPGVIAALSAYIYADPKIHTDGAYLQSIAARHRIRDDRGDD